MGLSFRILFTYLVFLCLGLGLLAHLVSNEVIPSVQQSLEEVLVDMANLLAETVKQDLILADLQRTPFARGLTILKQRRLEARVTPRLKHDSDIIVLITDQKGKVLYDSQGKHVGHDFSRWNDVHLTLQGKYGSRITRTDPSDRNTSVLYVAAPIVVNGQMIGVLSVGKPSHSIFPYFKPAIQSTSMVAILLLSTSFILILLIIFWLNTSVDKLTTFANAVRDGKKVKAPDLKEQKFSLLSNAMDEMQQSLEGKKFAAKYLRDLSNELKNPLAAIHGATEILQESLPTEQRTWFVENIGRESRRLQRMIDRLHDLAMIEQRQALKDLEMISTKDLIKNLCADKIKSLEKKRLKIEDQNLSNTWIEAEPFILKKAINGLTDNAIDFSFEQGEIIIEDRVLDNHWELVIRDHGPGIPDYALPQVFDRFYSLQRSDVGQKGIGLGLNLVHESVQLHHGLVELRNCTSGGAEARLRIPLRQPD